MRFYFLIIFSLVFNSIFGQNVKLILKSAEQYCANGYYEDAIEQYNKALEIDPRNGEAYQERARTYEKLNLMENAAHDYISAAVFGLNPAENFLQSANLSYKSNNYEEALSAILKAIEVRPKYHEAYLLQCQVYLKINKYDEAYTSSINALETKGSAFAQYLKGLTEFYLGRYSEAHNDLNKAISKDKLLLDSYLTLAEVQLISKETQFAIENCQYVLSIDKNNHYAYYILSKARGIRREYKLAIDDISKAISIDSTILKYYLQRAELYLNNSENQRAIEDLSLVLSKDVININALHMRAEAYEKLQQINNAISDYSLLLTVAGESNNELVYSTKKKIYELKREDNRPEILLISPALNINREAMVPGDCSNTEIVAKVDDASMIKLFKINNDTLLFDTAGISSKEFHMTLPTSGLEFITLTAVDIYDNSSSVSYAVERFETHAPTISLTNPYPDKDNIINITDNDRFLYLEGWIEDENLISSIQIDELNASYAPRDINPRFTATVDISKKNRLLVEATDIYGNTTKKEYFFRLENQLLNESNPMGKTWVILIENSEYKYFSNLSSPSTDIELVQQALSRYKINKIIVKRNLTKREMERFFSIDLRDLARANNVNSLFIWFAGHGKYNNGIGYWIPSDATTDDEFSYFNVNALKASLYSYSSLSHILVVSDACEAGPAFCLALRSPIESVACSETHLAEKKSAQVFTSAGAGYAYDDSFFTKAFTNALLNNENDCSSIEDIVKKVTTIMQSHSNQSPEFGRISGLPDELGTFFFMTR